MEGVVDAYPKPYEPRQIPLRHTQTNALMGIELALETQVNFLQRLCLEVVTPAGIAPMTGMRLPHTTVFRIPAFESI